MTLLQKPFSKASILCLLLLSLSLVCEATFHKWLMMLQHPPKDACPTKCCEMMKCPKPKCHPHQKMKHGAGWCGCCPKCMTQLKMGHPCTPKPKHPCPKMPSSECGHGLKCKHGKCCK